MVEYDASAELDVTVNEASVRSVRQKLERELGDIEVGVSSAAPTGRAVGQSGPESADIDLARKNLGKLHEVVDLGEERNELLLELIEETGDDGAASGGIGGLGGAALGAGAVLGIPAIMGGLGSAAGRASGALGRAGGAIGDVGRAAGAAGSTFAGVPSAVLGQAERMGITGIGDRIRETHGELPGDTTQASLLPPPPEDMQMQIPADFPPELQVPDLPDFGIEVPSAFQQLAEGLGIDINVNTQSDITVTEEHQALHEADVERLQRERLRNLANEEAEKSARQLEERIRRELQGSI